MKDGEGRWRVRTDAQRARWGENMVVVRESRARAMGVRKGTREEVKRTRWWWALERSKEKRRIWGV